MSQPFIGEIRMFGGNFAPFGWAFCNGAVMSISQNEALFALIGTTYGGDGQTHLQSAGPQRPAPRASGRHIRYRAVVGYRNGHAHDEPDSPTHARGIGASLRPTAGSPSGAVYGGNTTDAIYTATPSAQMNAAMVGIGGGSQPHDNMMPYRRRQLHHRAGRHISIPKLIFHKETEKNGYTFYWRSEDGVV